MYTTTNQIAKRRNYLYKNWLSSYNCKTAREIALSSPLYLNGKICDDMACYEDLKELERENKIKRISGYRPSIWKIL